MTQLGFFYLLVLAASNLYAADEVTPPADLTVKTIDQSSEGNSYKNLLKELLKARDPFKRLSTKINKIIVQSELENFTVDEFKMIGVITGLERRRAIVIDPKGKTHLVGERMKIGTRGGIIKKISSEKITVNEKLKNILGEDEWVESIIDLKPDSKTLAEMGMGPPPSGMMTAPPPLMPQETQNMPPPQQVMPPEPVIAAPMPPPVPSVPDNQMIPPNPNGVTQ